MPVRNWSLTILQLSIFFEGWTDEYLRSRHEEIVTARVLFKVTDTEF